MNPFNPASIFWINISKKLLITNLLAKINSYSEVSIHFNKINHVEDDFSFYIVKSDLKQDIIRKSTETDLINPFLKFDIPIMNKKIPKIESIKTLSFS